MLLRDHTDGVRVPALLVFDGEFVDEFWIFVDNLSGKPDEEWVADDDAAADDDDADDDAAEDDDDGDDDAADDDDANGV